MSESVVSANLNLPKILRHGLFIYDVIIFQSVKLVKSLKNKKSNQETT